MGFCLPGATGVCIASGKQPVVCVTGEGSLQMNIQELQTIRQNHLPIKLFVINNQGYHSIRQTQQSYFGEPLVDVYKRQEQILGIVDNYCRKYHNQEKTFKEGDRIPYASRVYDSKEMVNLVAVSYTHLAFCL